MKKGFTLIEVMIVIAILLILAGIFMPKFMNLSVDTSTKVQIEQIEPKTRLPLTIDDKFDQESKY